MHKRLLTSLEVVVAVLFFLVLAALLLPAITGFVLKSEVKSQLSAQLPLGYQFTKLSYQQGWFRSRVSASLLSSKGKEYARIQNTFYHGPLYFGMLTRGQWPLLKAFIESDIHLSSKPDNSLHIETVWRVDDRLDGYFQVGSSGEQAAFVSNDNAGSFSYELERSMLSLRYQLPKFNVENYESVLSLENLNVTAHYKFKKHWQGDLLISFDKLTADKNNALSPRLALQKAQFKLTGLRNSAGFNYSLDAKASYARYEKMMLSDVEFDTRLKSLEYTRFDKLKTWVLARIDGDESLVEGVAEVPDWLGKGEFEISHFSFNTEKGDMGAWLRLSFPDYEDAGFFDPVYLLSSMRCDVEFSAKKTLLRTLYEDHADLMFKKENPDEARMLSEDDYRLKARKHALQKLDTLVEQKYLEETQDRYETVLHVDNGLFELNGFSVNPMQILFFQGSDT